MTWLWRKKKVKLLKSQFKRKVLNGKFSASPTEIPSLSPGLEELLPCSLWWLVSRCTLLQGQQIAYALVLLHNNSSYSGLGCMRGFFLHTLFAANKLRKEIYSLEWGVRSVRRPQQDWAAEPCSDSASTGNICSEQPHLLSPSAPSTRFINWSWQFILILLLGFFFHSFSWSVLLLSVYKVIY